MYCKLYLTSCILSLSTSTFLTFPDTLMIHVLQNYEIWVAFKTIPSILWSSFSQTKDFKNVFRWKQKKKSWNGKIFEEWRVVKSPKGEWFWVTRECLDAVRSNYYICTLAHKCKNSGLHIIRWWSFALLSLQVCEK